MDQPPSNIREIYKAQGWNDEAAITGDINAGNWKNKVPSSGSSGSNVDLSVPSIAEFSDKAYAPADEALKQLVMTMRGQKKPLDVYTELENAAGLPERKKIATTLREQIGGLEDTIRRVEGNVAATTKESLVTEGQRAGMVEARQKPLIENLGVLTTGLGRVEQGISAAMADLGIKIDLYTKGQEQELKPYELQVTALQDRAARVVSGFTADVQNKLTTLMAKWTRQNELDDREVDQAFELLKSENAYNAEIKKMKEQSGIDIAEYTKKKQIDKSFETPTGTGDADKYYGKTETTGAAKTISDIWNTFVWEK